MEQIFSNRELATIIWLFVFSVYAISKQEVRNRLIHLLQQLISKPITITFLITLCYVVIEIWALQKIGIWQFSLLKDTIFWFLFSSLALLFKVVSDANKEGVSFSQLLKENLGILIVIEFLLSTYTFSLIGELILLPIILFLILVVAMNQQDPKQIKFIKFCEFLLATIGLFTIFYSIYMAFKDPTIWSLHSLRQLFIVPALTILFIPFLYMFSLYSIYDSMFWRITSAFKNNKDLAKHTKCHVFRTGLVNLNTTRRLSKVIARKIWSVEDIRGVQHILNIFRDPPIVKLGDSVRLSITNETGTVEKIKEDFAMVKYSDGIDESWIGDLEIINNF